MTFSPIRRSSALAGTVAVLALVLPGYAAASTATAAPTIAHVAKKKTAVTRKKTTTTRVTTHSS